MNGQGKNCSQDPNKSPVTDLDYQVLVQYYLQLFRCEALYVMFLPKKNSVYLALALIPFLDSRNARKCYQYKLAF